MDSSKKLVIIGAGSVGGHLAMNLDDYYPGGELIGFLDDDTSKIGNVFCGFKVLGPVSEIGSFGSIEVVIGIAFPKIKKQILDEIAHLGHYEFPKMISKHAWVSKGVSVGDGAIIYPGCCINYGSSIDRHVVMNLNCSIGHHSTVGGLSSLAPGVNLAGHTTIEEGGDIGIGVSTRQSVVIGKYSVIGGNSMVTSDIPSFSLAYGVPAKLKRRRVS
ncbi:hypothetical protein [uncultured Imperialibacter sp.]|uniref:hypothetical protein n=1 Tax=uncultured Imperialibacter sp. TaxID=1672639 RepID=UPI0030DB16A0|tara:strand:+ start:31664 stop:32311 length:648 start_codon:yes stop_codon:yes gene_type:complete